MDSPQEVIAAAAMSAPIDEACPLSEYLSYNAEDAIALGARLTDGKFHGYSDIREMQHEWVRAEIGKRVSVAILAALDAAGYAVVPKEPTPKMLQAYSDANWTDWSTTSGAAKAYRAMLAEAPKS